jgi:hypothetical protein
MEATTKEKAPRKPQDAVKSIVDSFISKGRRKKAGGYEISPDFSMLTFTTSGTPNTRYLHEKKSLVSTNSETLAIRINRDGKEIVVGNSSGLSFVGSYQAWGRRYQGRGQQKVQRLLAEKIPMLPFSVFDQANLNIQNLTIVDQTPAETILRKFTKHNPVSGKSETVRENVHFTGATLFEVDGKQFLFDIDRREVKHGIFNPFLVKMPKPCKTIAAAYVALKPKAVRDAEKKGLKVLRQGEWFFIPTERKIKHDVWKSKDEPGNWRSFKKGTARELELRAGPNRPNHAQMGNVKLQAVKGRISHSGREHANLFLKGWHFAVPNTATESFTITGDVD